MPLTGLGLLVAYIQKAGVRNSPPDPRGQMRPAHHALRHAIKTQTAKLYPLTAEEKLTWAKYVAHSLDIMVKVESDATPPALKRLLEKHGTEVVAALATIRSATARREAALLAAAQAKRDAQAKADAEDAS